MKFAERDRIGHIERLNLPPNLKAFLIDLDCPSGMQRLFQTPYYFYSQGAPDNPGNWPTFSDRNLAPLWEHGELIVAVDIGVSSPEYLSFYLEFPDDYKSYGNSIYKALFHMLELHVWEYGGGEVEAEEAQRLAKRLGFPLLSELSAMLADPLCSQERIDRYLGEIV